MVPMQENERFFAQHNENSVHQLENLKFFELTRDINALHGYFWHGELLGPKASNSLRIGSRTNWIGERILANRPVN